MSVLWPVSCLGCRQTCLRCGSTTIGRTHLSDSSPLRCVARRTHLMRPPATTSAPGRCPHRTAPQALLKPLGLSRSGDKQALIKRLAEERDEVLAWLPTALQCDARARAAAAVGRKAKCVWFPD